MIGGLSDGAWGGPGGEGADMYSVVTATLLFGGVFGCTLRVPHFIVAALAVTLIELVLAGWQQAILSAVALQVGYALGLVLMAAFSRFFRRLSP